MEKNIELLLASLSISYERFQQALERCSEDLNNQNYQTNLFETLGTTLHWLLDCIERLPCKMVSDADKPFFSALRYANNSLKHEKELITLHNRIGGFEFPISFPFECPCVQYIWHNLECKQKRFVDQHSNYQKLLANNDVLETLETAKEKITTYYNMMDKPE